MVKGPSVLTLNHRDMSLSCLPALIGALVILHVWCVSLSFLKPHSVTNTLVGSWQKLIFVAIFNAFYMMSSHQKSTVHISTNTARTEFSCLFTFVMQTTLPFQGLWWVQKLTVVHLF